MTAPVAFKEHNRVIAGIEGHCPNAASGNSVSDGVMSIRCVFSGDMAAHIRVAMFLPREDESFL